ncbi:NUDIX domain-containing protein [Nocardiopsis sp. NPDC057823]|uniref:NUDIX domain-containing protein n=1 Tax=Nocardiopsis sp. NPDC057823 TaxID=3346256 RepID=UPI00366B46C4
MRLGVLPPAYDSVVCLTHRGGRALMVRNRRRAWEFPGGHAEAGEGVVDTARREAAEEAGATLGAVEVAGYYVLADGHVTVVTHAPVLETALLSGEFETVEVREFDVLPPEESLSWADGLYAHLLRALDLPGARP